MSSSDSRTKALSPQKQESVDNLKQIKLVCSGFQKCCGLECHSANFSRYSSTGSAADLNGLPLTKTRHRSLIGCSSLMKMHLRCTRILRCIIRNYAKQCTSMVKSSSSISHHNNTSNLNAPSITNIYHCLIFSGRTQPTINSLRYCLNVSQPSAQQREEWNFTSSGLSILALRSSL